MNEQTPHLGLPLPHPANDLGSDVLRLRAALQALDGHVNALQSALQSDDVALDQLQELVDAIKANRGDIAALMSLKASAEALEAEVLAREQAVAAEAQARAQADQALQQAIDGKQPSMTTATAAEMQAGTVTDLRAMSPSLVAQAVEAPGRVLTDPTLLLDGTSGTAGQVPVSQGAGLPPVWGSADSVDSPYKTKRISLSAALTTTSGTFSTNAEGSRHFAFGDLFLYENSNGGFVVIDTATETLVQQASFGFIPIYFAKVSETRLLVGRVFNAQAADAYIQLTLYSVSSSGVDLVTPVARDSISTPYCLNSANQYALPVVALTESKFLLGFISYRSGTAYLDLTPVVYTTTFTRGNISERYLGPTLGYVNLVDAMRVDDNRAIIVTGYYAGGASDQLSITVVESTDGVAIAEGNSSPTSSYTRAYQYNPFDQASRPIYKVNELQFFVVTFNSNDSNTRRFSLLTLNASGTATNNSTLGPSVGSNLGSNGIVKVYKGATDSNIIVLSCGSNTSAGLDYFSISGTTLTARASTTLGSSNDGTSQQFAILNDARTAAYVFGALGSSGTFSLFWGKATITSTSLSYSSVASNVAANSGGVIRGAPPVKLANGAYAQITSLGAIQSDFSFRSEMRYKPLPIEGTYNSMNLVGSKTHIIGKGYIDIAEVI